MLGVSSSLRRCPRVLAERGKLVVIECRVIAIHISIRTVKGSGKHTVSRSELSDHADCLAANRDAFQPSLSSNPPGLRSSQDYQKREVLE